MAAPIVELNDVTVSIGSSIAAADLFSALDPDNQIVEYYFDDFFGQNTGYFVIDGVPQVNGGEFWVAAADLDKVRYFAGSQVRFEGFKVIARNEEGQVSDPNQRGLLYTVRENTSTPHVGAPNITVLGDEALPAANFLFGYDPDGYPIETYEIREGSKLLQMYAANDVITIIGYQHRFETGDIITISGANESRFNMSGFAHAINEHVITIWAPGFADGVATGDLFAFDPNDESSFAFDGIPLAQGQTHQIAASDLNRLSYHAAGPQDEENLHVRGWDGAEWSFEKVGTAVTNLNANHPVVQMTRAFTPARQFLTVGDHVVVTDADNNTPKRYQFLNRSPNPQFGELYLGDVIMPRQTWFEVSADQLDSVRFFTQNNIGQQQIAVRAYDGSKWSAAGTVIIDVGEPIIRAENEAATGVVIMEQLDPTPVAPLITKIDEGTPHTQFEIFEPTESSDSGFFRIGVTPLEANQIHSLNALEFQQLNFYSGDFSTRNIDPIYVRTANNEGDWSSWSKLEIRTEAEYDNSLTSGTTWTNILPRNPFTGKMEISYSFLQQFPSYESGEATEETFSRLTQIQRVRTREIFRDIEEVVNIQFTEIADTDFNILGQQGGIIRFGEYGEEDSDAGAYAFLPSTAPQGGDVWYNRETFGGQANLDFTPRTFGYSTVIHELGHALGLKHPFEGTPQLPGVTDNSDFTVMSYTRAPNGEPTTFQMYDIAELQELYGANMDTRLGDNTYSIWSTFEGSQTAMETIWDAGGNDTLSANGAATSAVIDLRQGEFSSIGALNRNIAIAFQTEIENAIGSSFGDQIFGNGSDNFLTGRDGDDYLFGNHGDDYLQGGLGNDTFEWGIGDGNDIIDEQGLGGTDRIVITDFPSLDSLSEDFLFERNGVNVEISLALDGDPIDNTTTILNQVSSGNQIETLEFGGFRIDLAFLTSALVDGAGPSKFEVLTSASSFGNLVAPV